MEQLFEQIASPDVKLMFKENVINMSNKYNLEEYDFSFNMTRPAIKQAYHDLFEKDKINALIFPTIPFMPKKFDDPVGDWEYIRNTSACTIPGMPGLSIPMQSSSDSMPIGLEFDGLENTDQLILCLGKLAQKALKNELN